MRLTGLPLIVLTALLAVLVIAATVLLWSRFGRWRLATRFAGVVLAEALVVLVIGLIANRSDGFYPSWQALRGDTGTATVTAPPPRGRLDATLTGTKSTLPWRPAGVAAWRLAGGPWVVLPAGYRDRPTITFPAVLVLVGGTAEMVAAVRAAQHSDGVVTVVATPTAGTTAAALGRLGVDLTGDVRVTAYGWSVITTVRDAALSAALIDAAPERYTAEALVGPAMPAGVHLNGPVAVAVVRSEPAGKPAPPGRGVTLTCPRGLVWTVATRWAAGQTSRPLQPAVRLPVGGR